MRKQRLTEVAETDKGYFSAKGFSGVALVVVGYPRTWEVSTFTDTDPETGEEIEVESEGEWVEDSGGDRVLVRMVGDDRDHAIDRSDLQPIKRADFCGGCGQIGCGCDPYDGDE